MASINWNLWHGKVGKALQKTEEVVNYLEEHKDYLHGETITTSFIESTVNHVVAKRFSKK